MLRASAPEVRLIIPKPTLAPEGAACSCFYGTTEVVPLTGNLPTLRKISSNEEAE
jgi:hypothetical protein